MSKNKLEKGWSRHASVAGVNDYGFLMDPKGNIWQHTEDLYPYALVLTSAQVRRAALATAVLNATSAKIKELEYQINDLMEKRERVLCSIESSITGIVVLFHDDDHIRVGCNQVSNAMVAKIAAESARRAKGGRHAKK